MHKEIEVLQSGAWDYNNIDYDTTCNLSPEFADYILAFLKDKNEKIIMDFGCATGYFLEYISKKTSDYELIGVEPHVQKRPDKHFDNILDYDLSVPFDLNKKGSIICLEVMEHVPAKYEQTMIENIVRHCSGYLFMSWAPRHQTEGLGHVNLKDEQEVIPLFMANGFELLVNESNQARECVPWNAHPSWLRRNTMIFKKI
jgi:2-polyprenyl-3-methyl-5-hydroxy-6-metoxy-1,4-benzoquinol methylase